MDKTNVIYQLKGLEEATIVDVKNLVSENIEETKMDSSIKKIISNHSEATITFEVKITKQKGLYNGIFTMSYPGDKESLRYEREDYKNLYDLINHAFSNFKERLSD